MASGHKWIVGLCSVIFDVDVGQRIDKHVGAPLTDEEKKNIAFHAFPDSMSLELQARSSIRDSSFFFRVKRRGSLKALQAPHADHVAPAAAPSPIASTQRAEQYLYGFAFCRQRQDVSLRRGGEQISVVVIAEHPFSNVLRPLSQVAGPMYFSLGEAALEQVYQEVSSWPVPTSGPQLQLQVGHTTLSARLPPFSTLPYPSCSSAVDQISRRNSSRHLSASELTLSHHMPPSLRSQPSSSSAPTPDALAAANSSLGSPNGDSPPWGVNEGLASAGASADFSSSSNLADLAGLTLSTSSPPAMGASSNTATAARGGSGGLPPLPPQAAPGGALSLSAGRTHSGMSPHGGSGASPHASGIIPIAIAQGPSSGGLSRLDSHLSINSLASGDGGDAAARGQAGPAQLQLPRRLSSSLEGHGLAHGAFFEVDVFTPLQSHLSSLWHLWELVLLGKPLLVAGLSPMDCSQTIAALIALIAPIPYAVDFRPYYTIQDPAFTQLVQGELPTPDSSNSVPCLIGITNLYFIKALPHWPNILSVGRKEALSSTWGLADAPATLTSTAAAAAAAMLNPGNAVKALRQRSKGAQALLAGHIESLWSTYKPVTRPDNTLLLRLLQPKANEIKSKVARISFANSDALQKHFFELTGALLAPFNRYFEPSMPNLHVPQWNEDEFLFSIRSNPPSSILLERLGNVNNIVELYARFISSHNFANWFQLRRQPVQHLMEQGPGRGGEGGGAGLDWFSKAKQHVQEVELIGIFFNVEQQLQESLQEATFQEAGSEVRATIARLQRELVTLFMGMPEDLQWTCISSPARRQLLLSMDLTPEQHARVNAVVQQLQQAQLS